MPNLLVMIGVPGCGKSTLIEDMIDLKYAVVSTDRIRKDRYGSLKAAHEAKSNPTVFAKAYERTKYYLAHNVDVVFDATSLTRKSRDDLRKIAEECDAKFIGMFFTNVDEALFRNEQRDEDSKVPKEAMDTMLVKYAETLRDIAQERFDRLIRIGSIR